MNKQVMEERDIATSFCISCGRRQRYWVKTNPECLVVRGVEFNYAKQIAYCVECGVEVYVPEINDANAQNRENAYRTAKKRLECKSSQEKQGGNDY